ncbi:hypothetical protein [Streptomyces lanatus]|nr:hypothetical protein [Streptomyces lanatus]
MPTTLMSWGSRTRPTQLEQIGGVLVTASNLGSTLGAVVGGIVVDLATDSTPLLIGGIAAIAGAALLSALCR